jgi:predicted RNase H-like HicB family nuclease
MMDNIDEVIDNHLKASKEIEKGEKTKLLEVIIRRFKRSHYRCEIWSGR